MREVSGGKITETMERQWERQRDKCQEIGLVALMFFFELLFPYVSSPISFYVSLANLFSIIPFLIC